MKTLEEVRKEKSEEEQSSLSAMKEIRDSLDSVCGKNYIEPVDPVDYYAERLVEEYCKEHGNL